MCMELVRLGMRDGETTGTIGPGISSLTWEVASMQHADTIKYIIQHLECRPEIIVRVPCLFCHNGRALLLVPSTGQYECQICGRYGKLDSLAVLAADQFEHRHRDSISLMEERRAVGRVRRR